MNVDEFVDYIVKNGMMKFPALVEKFSEEGLCKQLKQNIGDVYEVEKFEETNVLGRYNGYSGEIQILSDKKIDEDLMDKDIKIKHAAIHESVHALFRHNNLGNTGLKYNTIDLKKIKLMRINRSSEFKKMISYKSLKQVLIAMAKVYTGVEICGPLKPKNVAVNEGLTEWVTRHCMKGYGSGYGAETSIFMQLNCFKNKKDILSLGDAIKPNIFNVFNMNEKEFHKFSKEMDDRLFSEQMVTELTKDDETERLNPESIQYYEEQQKKHAISIQTTILNKVIFPEIKKEYSKENCDFTKFVELRYQLTCYLKHTNIKDDEIPQIKEFDLFYDKCTERNNKEFLENIIELKDNNGKINLFKLGSVTDRYFWDGKGGTAQKVLKSITGKEINKENVKDAIKEYYRFYRQETDRMNGKSTESKEQIEYKYIDRNMFSFEREEETETEDIQPPKKTFFRKIVDRVIKNKKITLEQVNEVQLENEPNQQSKSEKGEESLEK